MTMTRRRRTVLFCLVVVPFLFVQLTGVWTTRSSAWTVGPAGDGSSQHEFGRHVYLEIAETDVRPGFSIENQSVLEVPVRALLRLGTPGPDRTSQWKWHPGGLAIALAWTIVLGVLTTLAYREVVGHWRPAGRCDRCGYDLRFSDSGPCPECGVPVDRHWHRRRRENASPWRRLNLTLQSQSRRHRMRLVGVLLLLFGGAITSLLWVPRDPTYSLTTNTAADGQETVTAVESWRLGIMAYAVRDVTRSGTGTFARDGDGPDLSGLTPVTAVRWRPWALVLSILATLGIIAAGLLAFGWCRRRHRQTRPCLACGCPLAGLELTDCPACGVPVTMA